jgi:hypothetical protein
LAAFAAVKFPGNGALMSSSSETLFCARPSGAKQIIASASKTHFFIFVSNRL